MILNAGFVDAWAEAGHGEVSTSVGRHPNWRIDWIVHTPDLIAWDVEVIENRASDHSAVVATIAPWP
jgi:endonuclease/exonuclease/phosphatase (EEP) superfamily protein YafD